MGSKAKANELLTARLLEEQRWAYERKLEHRSIREIRGLVSRSPRDGGLGYDISEHTLKKLVAGYLERMAEVEADTVEFHRHRELADMDARQRAHSVLVDPINRAKLQLVATRLKLTPQEVIDEHPRPRAVA